MDDLFKNIKSILKEYMFSNYHFDSSQRGSVFQKINKRNNGGLKVKTASKNDLKDS